MCMNLWLYFQVYDIIFRLFYQYKRYLFGKDYLKKGDLLFLHLHFCANCKIKQPSC